MSDTAHSTRREFLCTAGRYVTLGGLLAGSGFLVARTPQAQATCQRRLPCANCSQFDACLLPPAETARQSAANGTVPAVETLTPKAS